jgi:hypothetical protein
MTSSNQSSPVYNSMLVALLPIDEPFSRSEFVRYSKINKSSANQRLLKLVKGGFFKKEKDCTGTFFLLTAEKAREMISTEKKRKSLRSTYKKKEYVIATRCRKPKIDNVNKQLWGSKIIGFHGEKVLMIAVI